MCEWNRWTILQDLVLALVINTSATLLAGAPLEWATWYPFTCVAFTTNVVAQLVLPTRTIAHALTGWAGKKSWRPYCEVFIENLIFVTIISLTEAFTQVFATAGFGGMIAAWWSTYLWLMLIGYVTSVVLFTIGSRRG